MKKYALLVAVLSIGIGFSLLFPRLITREPYDADIPIRVKLVDLLSRLMIIPPKLAIWLQSREIPQSSDNYDFSFETVSYNYKGEDVSFQTNVYIPSDLSKDELDETPILLFFHGGGFVIGHPNTLDPFFQHVMNNENERMIIVCPNYRKIPDVTYDEIMRDSLETLRWIKRRFNEGLEEDRKLIVSGESAGGKLTLALAYHLKREGYEEYPKSRMVLVPIYSVFCHEREIEDKDCRKDSSFKKGYITSEAGINRIHTNDRDAPWFREEVEFWFDFNDLEDLPSVLVVTAEYDYLRDEAINWVAKFGNDEKPDYVMVEGEVHGFVDPMVACKPESSIELLADIVLERGMKLFKPENK